MTDTLATDNTMTGSRYRCSRDSRGTVTDAWIDLGPYLDTDFTASAAWRVYTGGDSMWGGLITGGTASGKTNLMEAIAYSLAVSGHTALWHIDGQGIDGRPVSSAFIPQVAENTAASPYQCDRMLNELMHVIADRAAANPGGGFVPTPETPGIAVLVEDVQLAAESRVADRWNKIVRTGRQAGVAVIASASTDLGSWAELRNGLVGGNMVMQRFNTPTAAMAFRLDATVIPNQPGYGWVVSEPGEPPVGMFRSAYCPNFLDLWRRQGHTAATTGIDL